MSVQDFVTLTERFLEVREGDGHAIEVVRGRGLEVEKMFRRRCEFGKARGSKRRNDANSMKEQVRHNFTIQARA